MNSPEHFLDSLESDDSNKVNNCDRFSPHLFFLHDPFVLFRRRAHLLFCRSNSTRSSRVSQLRQKAGAHPPLTLTRCSFNHREIFKNDRSGHWFFFVAVIALLRFLRASWCSRSWLFFEVFSYATCTISCGATGLRNWNLKLVPFRIFPAFCHPTAFRTDRRYCLLWFAFSQFFDQKSAFCVISRSNANFVLNWTVSHNFPGQAMFCWRCEEFLRKFLSPRPALPRERMTKIWLQISIVLQNCIARLRSSSGTYFEIPRFNRGWSVICCALILWETNSR